MKISARNSLKGTISAITVGPVSTEVTIKIAPKLELVSVITTNSSKKLKLKVGKRPTRSSSPTTSSSASTKDRSFERRRFAPSASAFYGSVWGGSPSWRPAIMTSVDLTIASASSPRRSFNARTASAVMTAVIERSPIRSRTWARSPSIRTSSMNPSRRLRALKPPRDSSGSAARARWPVARLLVRHEAVDLRIRDAMMTTLGTCRPHVARVDPSFERGVRDT